MIMGPLENVTAVSLMPGQGPTEYQEILAKTLDSMPEGSLVLADLFGGTPSNCCAILSRTRRIGAVSGLCLPMLIEAVNLRESLSGEELVQSVIEAAKNGIRDIIQAVNGRC
jgi:mannose/fructose-specific phosphotransferase system component IIA